MNIRKLLQELVAIQNDPNPGAVQVAVRGVNTTYTFPDSSAPNAAYYYPAGIRGVTVARGGANVVYVYTSTERVPHLTIPDTGADLHWTTSDSRSYDMREWPQAIQKFVALFP
jgi:hypothetical protein